MSQVTVTFTQRKMQITDDTYTDIQWQCDDRRIYFLYVPATPSNFLNCERKDESTFWGRECFLVDTPVLQVFWKVFWHSFQSLFLFEK